MASLALHGVSKQFRGGVIALDDVSFTVADGELVTIVGPSGCGKSTLLRIIAGLEQASLGEVVVGGRTINSLQPGKRNIAMVFQGGANFPHLTVRQNLGIGLRIRHARRSEVSRRVAEVAEILGMTAMLDRRPAELSGGENQRVAIGRAMLREPDLLLMDEPLSNLDAHLRLEMRREIARLQRQVGTTMLFVTHDQSEALTLGSRVAVMRAGVVEQLDTPKDLYDHPATAFVASFVGTPAMNLIRMRISSGVGLVGKSSVALPPNFDTSRDAVVAGVRPGDLRLGQPLTPHDWSFPVEVELVELLGAELHVTARIDGSDQSLVIRVDRSHPIAAGDRLSLSVPVTAMHWFPE